VATEQPSEDGLQLARRVLSTEIEAIERTAEALGDEFIEAVDRISKCRSSLVLVGLGKSGYVAGKLSATFASLGCPSHFVHAAEALHGDLGRFIPGDVVILLSNSGTTAEVLGVAREAARKELFRISMTSNRESPLSAICDLNLHVPITREACLNNLAPTASTTAMMALGDALAIAVSKAKGFSAENFHGLHPGGRLGLEMTTVDEFLKSAGSPYLTFNEETVLSEMLADAVSRNSRAGAFVLVGEAGTITGLFTDGDLRRLLAREGAAGLSLKAVEVMTRSPKRAVVDQRIREVVELMARHKVDEVPVVDREDRPAGLIDIQDLLRLGIVRQGDR